jgi:thioredoxin-like negative regulator of GroEL
MAKLLAAGARAIAFGCVAAMLLTVVDAHAHVNPTVRESFFEELQLAAPANKPAAVDVDGSVTEVTWQGLAWEVENTAKTKVPLVVQFYSSDPLYCLPWRAVGECAAQLMMTPRVASQYAGRVRFVRFDVNRHPSLLHTVDVPTLPLHMFVVSYTDTAHYEATAVKGFIDEVSFQNQIEDVFGFKP